MISFLKMAAELALPTHENDPRNFWLAAFGIRKDGAIVSARNGATSFSARPIKRFQIIANSHAEGRVLGKLGKGGIIFVARVARKDGSWAMSRPCFCCQTRIKAAKVEKVIYTIDSTHYGVWHVNKDYDKIYDV